MGKQVVAGLLKKKISLVSGELASAGMPNQRFVIPQLRCLYIFRNGR